MILWLVLGLCIQLVNFGCMLHFGLLPDVSARSVRARILAHAMWAAIFAVGVVLWPMLLLNAYLQVRRMQQQKPK